MKLKQLIIDLIATFIFALFNIYLGLIYSSFWYGSFSIFLILSLFLKVLILIFYYHNIKGIKDNRLNLFKNVLRIFFILMNILIIIVFSTMVYLIISLQKPIISNEIIAISIACYTTLKIVLAILSYNKNKNNNDYLFFINKIIKINESIISLILLEATLITTFGEFNNQMRLLVICSALIAFIIITFFNIKICKIKEN